MRVTLHWLVYRNYSLTEWSRSKSSPPISIIIIYIKHATGVDLILVCFRNTNLNIKEVTNYFSHLLKYTQKIFDQFSFSFHQTHWVHVLLYYCFKKIVKQINALIYWKLIDDFIISIQNIYIEDLAQLLADSDWEKTNLNKKGLRLEYLSQQRQVQQIQEPAIWMGADKRHVWRSLANKIRGVFQHFSSIEEIFTICTRWWRILTLKKTLCSYFLRLLLDCCPSHYCLSSEIRPLIRSIFLSFK